MTSNIDIAPRLESTIQALVLEVIRDVDLFLVELRIRGRQGSKVVEIYLDGESGVTVDQLASVSKKLAVLLETEDLIKGKYSLSVSSPGSDRALQLPRQYKQHSGRTIELRTRSQKDENGNGRVRGELVSASDTELILKLGSGENQTYTFEEIKEARISQPW